MIPACRGDAGAATVDSDDIGSSSVIATPSANAAVSTTNMSGRRFTLFYAFSIADLAIDFLSIDRPARVYPIRHYNC